MKSKDILRNAALVIVMMISSFHAYAQSDPITIDTELSRTRVYVGDELTYQVIIRGAANAPPPVIEFPSSIRASYNGRSSQSFTSVRMINGRNRTVTDRRYSYQYTLTAIESGKLTVPAPSIEVDGKRYIGRPVSFESLFPAQADADDMMLTIERHDLYRNETVVVECIWWIGAQTAGLSFSSSNLPESFRIMGLEPITTGRERASFELNGQKMVGIADTDPSDPYGRTKFVFRFTITPTQIGTFDLGPLRAVFTRRSNTGESYKAYVESDTQQLTVRDVPTENQPQGYAGAIGEFRLKAHASNTTVNVGDPIVLTLKITAPEPMIGIDDAPNLSDDPRFSDQFKISTDGWREIRPRQSGQRIYETTIRALNEHVDQIPPIKLPSFNPAAKAYRIYQSSPIELVVHPVQEFTLSDAIITGDSSRQSPTRENVEYTELTDVMPGLWAHDTADDIMTQTGFSVSDTLKHPGWIATIATGPAVFAFSLVIVAARRVSDPHEQAMQRAWKRSRALARHGNHAQAFRVYLAATLEINEDAVAAEDALGLPIREEDAHLIAQLLADDECGKYVGQSRPQASSSTLPAGLLKEVHTQLKHNRRARS